MIRRLAKPAAALVTMASIVLTVPPEFLEAVTANLHTLISTDGTLTEGDKTFSNFSFTSTATLPPPAGTSLVIPTDTSINVSTSIGPGGVITLTFPLNMSVGTEAGGLNSVFADVSVGFDVAVTGSSDVISAVTVTATGDPSDGALASVVTTVTGLSTAFTVTAPGTGGSAVPNSAALTVGATASLGAVPGEEPTSAEIEDMVFGFPQTTPSPPSAPVPEPGSLTLILGGLGMLLARSLYRRQA